jgi:PAS domain S-box-containing protein
MSAQGNAGPWKGEEPRVLIVDDEKDFVHSLEDILESRGYRVEKAHSPKTACEKLNRFDAQVALLDIRLGRADGISLIAKLGKARSGIICVMMTAYAAIDTAISALQEGAYDYLRKPFEADDLLATLDRCFEKIRLENEKTAAEKALRNRNRELEKINARLRQIVEATQGFAACNRMAEIAPLLLEEFARNMAAGGGSLFLREQDGLVLIHSLDPGHAPTTIAFPLHKGSAFDKAVKTGQPVLIKDIKEEKETDTSGWRGYKDGSLLVFPLSDEKGDIVGIISLHNKVAPPFTPQDKELGSILASHSCETLRAAGAVEALQESQERLNAIMDSIKTGILVIDAETHRIADSNPAALEMIGVSRDRLLGSVCHEYICPTEKGKYPITDLDRNVDSAEWILISASDEEIPILKTSNCVILGGKEHIVESFIDTTERKQLQTQLQQAQKMEAIGTLAGGIAHDFNNLLQAILGYTQMLLFDRKKEDPGFADLKGIEKAGLRASELTQQLLTFSRKVESQLRPVDINQEIIQVEKLLKRTIPKMIDIELNLNDTLKIINADPTQMEQVLMNLAVNARDAMPDGGKLIIGTDNLVLNEEFCRINIGAVPGTYVMLAVSDTGHGMDRETLEHIFEPFYTTKEIGKGTGLGLAMVYGIVKNHSGYITCNSEAGSGTIFKIYLPIIEEATDEELGDEPEAMPEGGTETILLVDDESYIRDLGKRMLPRFGYTVLTAVDGESALALYREKKGRISLVILDLSMPRMGGERCLEELLRTDPGAKVIIASGYAVDEPKAKVMKAGACGFVGKPYEMKKLLKVIREVIDTE